MERTAGRGAAPHGTTSHDTTRHDKYVQYRSDMEVRFEKVDYSLSEQNRLLYCSQEDILNCYFYVCTFDFWFEI